MGQWFSPGTPVSSTNNTDCHDIAEILLKVALNPISQAINQRAEMAWTVMGEVSSHIYSTLQVEEVKSKYVIILY